MKLKMRILMLMGSLMLLVFAVNVGIASADGPHLGPDNNGLAESGAAAPHIIFTGPDGTLGSGDAGSANGAVNGFGYDFDAANESGNPGDGVDFSNPAVIGITHSPLCPLHPSD